MKTQASAGAGRRYWRSLEEAELAESPEFLERLRREFPEQAATFDDPAGRREFLKRMGASLALAGIGTACTRQPEEAIVPYVRAPEDVVPGRPLHFATAVLDGGYAKGVLVESHMGRPTKVEGNPDHPASLGATDVFGQAAILGLYDPDRSQALKFRGEMAATWNGFLTAMKVVLEAQRPLRGAGIRILTETVTSPTLAAQIESLLAELPEARWHAYQPAGRDNVRGGAVLAFGEPLETHYRFATADVILSLDADFISEEPGSLRYIREFSERRRSPADAAASGMNRLYAVESVPSLTGAMADHRLPLKPSQVEGFARAVAAGVGLAVEGGLTHPWVAPLVEDLQAHPGRSLVIAGAAQPPVVHALAHLINHRLANQGRTVVSTAPVTAGPADQTASLCALADDMKAGRVDLLLILGGNPAYAAPADVGFASALEAMPRGALRVHLSPYEDETSGRCEWHIPEAHPLESWSDARAFDGTVTVLQPLIAPLYAAAKSAHEVLAALSRRPERTAYEILREHWKDRIAGDFERGWRRALHDGLIEGTALPDRDATPRLGEWARSAPAPTAGIELSFRPDPCVGDGRHANNGWLQELPKPLTKLTWDNAALLGPETARRLGIAPRAETSRGLTADVVELRHRGRVVRAPVWIQPGHPEDAVTVHLGYGRRRAGRVGTGLGFDAYALRTSDAPWFAGGLEVVKTGTTTVLACTQDHWAIEADREAHERHLIRPVTNEEYRRDPHVVQAMGHDPKPEGTLYPPHRYEGHAWGMTIDLSACVGCNACVTACQAENNIPVVGKDQVARGREMHWIRIDRYHGGDPYRAETVQTHHQPVLCMHCENAPCEVVCPVAATVHSDEGLNDMVYNRCVGTRYCANNCPYKVRRFNFFLYQDWSTPSLKMMRNPDVTVRSRGVMEKCTYCVQRINQARIEARREDRAIRDGEVQTACQQACPARAIVFGDVNDPASAVSRRKAEPRNYGLLTDLNTRPRTSYLAQLRNPNPEMPRA
jgi:molybdopterin-containing oxidoreductase family iron-sulfur binding subunit